MDIIDEGAYLQYLESLWSSCKIFIRLQCSCIYLVELFVISCRFGFRMRYEVQMFQLEPDFNESLVLPLLTLRGEGFIRIGTLTERRSRTYTRNISKTSIDRQRGGVPKLFIWGEGGRPRHQMPKVGRPPPSPSLFSSSLSFGFLSEC